MITNHYITKISANSYTDCLPPIQGKVIYSYEINKTDSCEFYAHDDAEALIHAPANVRLVKLAQNKLYEVKAS